MDKKFVNGHQVCGYKIHIVLTDNSMAFADLPKNRTGPVLSLACNDCTHGVPVSIAVQHGRLRYSMEPI